ncbi:VanZ family protein [Daejeonella sp. H1SJ63]|jgi:VanZ family protein|uniref:VanZ family protein n=1 Tax=Daejeonella sp. H1SJ63 TaxID=3034145 RepID=UPI0023EAFB78|nr:VanZ family protein [Daejeonella sp. H1SJ63]
MLKTLRYQLPSILWAIFITILCEMPGLDTARSGVSFFEGFDKLAHTGFFFVLTVLLFYGKIREQSSYSYRPLTILKILTITFALGALIEILQMKIFTYRSAEWWDLFADMTGVGMGVFSYVLLHRVRFNEKLH